MTGVSAIDSVLRAFLGNPFARENRVFEAGRRAVVGLDLARELSTLVRQRDVDRAELLVLAAGHAAAAAGEEERWEAALRPVARSLPRPLGDYRRIALAAARCASALDQLRGASSAMQAARAETWAACFGDSLRHALELERVIRDQDVLILGETGTGKELFARAIQAATPGSADGAPAPRSAINAAAIPDTLVESELFGHVKGAFTGATDTRPGRLRTAHGGTFFLDEVGDLPSTTQVKLLRVIETNEVYAVGSDAPFSIDVRYVAATHKNLAEMAARGEFRTDFYERLAGNVLVIPPLRDRPDDIVEIGRQFVQAYVPGAGDRRRAGSERIDLRRVEAWLTSAEARRYRWPGNVRQLQNALRNLLLGLTPDVDPSDEPAPGDASPAGLPVAIRDATAPLRTVEQWYVHRVIAACEGNQARAARSLGVDRSTLRRWTRRV